MNKFINQKINLAQKLYDSSDFATYADATLIICTALSAIAAEMWPGENIDRKRFTELIVRYADKNLKNDWVSVPLLHQCLKEKNTSPFTTNEYSHLLENSLILTENDIDSCEVELLKQFPQLDKKIVREYSYSHLIYKELRCAYSHEYAVGKKAHSLPMTSRDACVSYVNRLNPKTNITYKMICFHFNYLLDIINHINTKLQPLENYFNQNPPKQWWIEGA